MGFDVPEVLKKEFPLSHLVPFSCFGESVKTALWLQSELDLAGLGEFANHRFSILWRLRFLGVFFRCCFMDFCRFVMILGVHLSFIWRPWKEG